MVLMCVLTDSALVTTAELCALKVWCCVSCVEFFRDAFCVYVVRRACVLLLSMLLTVLLTLCVCVDAFTNISISTALYYKG